MTDIKIVTFKKDWRGYAVGETAGFDTVTAEALIESGRAKLYVEKAVSEKAVKSPAGKKAKKPAAQQSPEQQEEEQQQEEQEQQEEEEEQQEQQENEDLDEKP